MKFFNKKEKKKDELDEYDFLSEKDKWFLRGMGDGNYDSYPGLWKSSLAIILIIFGGIFFALWIFH